MPYAFVSHSSAIEALRSMGLQHPLWPETHRLLPTHGDCIHTQREFARLAREARIGELGIHTYPVDILVPVRSMRTRGKSARTHVWASLIPPFSMLRMHPHVLVSAPEFALLQLANTHVRIAPLIDRSAREYLEAREELDRAGMAEQARVRNYRAWEKTAHLVRTAVLAMELMGTYRLGVPDEAGTRYGQPALTSVASLHAYADLALQAVLLAGEASRFVEPVTPLGYRHSTAFGVLDRIAPWLMENSRSPRETALALMLTLPSELGGFGLPKPLLNHGPSSGAGPTPDFLWEEKGLVLEYDSREFHAGRGQDKVDADIARANALRASGKTVLEVTPGLIGTLAKVSTLAREIATILEVELPRLDDEQLFFREMLFELLLKGDRSDA